MNIYEGFLNLNINTSFIGLEKGNEDINYFCTPVGAEIIGLEGVDGIHYCFIEGFKDMVFAVNPMSCCDKYVYPLANSFEAFIRLILATNCTSALEQIILWSKEEFEKYLIDSSIFPEQTEVLKILTSKLNLTAHPQPYEYVKELQASFDYSKLIFSDEYFAVLGLT